MSMMRGRLFEKVGVHCSTVHGEFAPEFRAQIPGAADDPAVLGLGHFADRASAQSARAGRAHEHPLRRHHQGVVRRRRRPHAGARPAPHPGGRRHAGLPRRDEGRLRRARRRSPITTSYKKWCDEYFYLPHRKEARGIGGIFYDWHRQRRLGRRFRLHPGRRPRLPARSIPNWCGAISHAPWTAADREEQLIRRGRYVEFNLLYDRGTIFGLKTGGNVDSILSSMPPEVKWP